MIDDVVLKWVFAITVIKMWNSLPDEVVIIEKN